MQISENGIRLIAEFEGGQSADGLYRAYWDAYGHVWTIGIGETAGVHAGMVWTRDQAYADLRQKMAADYAPAINGLGVPLSQNQFDALCSFIWNVGPGSMQWDVGRYLRERNYGAAANALLEYDRAGGVVLGGLVTRRRAERDLFLTPDPKPDPLLIFPTDIPGYGNERKLVQEVNGALKHPDKYRGYLKGDLYWRCKRHRDRLWRLAHEGSPRDWVSDHRGLRWQRLNDLMKAIAKL